MGLAEYVFAFFIFMLACVFMLLCKYLFGRTKNHLRALDEKEKKLLSLYSTLEDMMDEFNDSALQANSELGHHIAEMRNVAASLRNNPAQLVQAQTVQAAPPQAALPQAAGQTLHPQAQTAPPPVGPQTQARHRGAAPPRPNSGPSFEAPLFEVISEIPAAAAAAPNPANAAKSRKTEADRPARILALHKNGMDRLHIAKELSVTLSEVDLVLGIAGQRK